MERLTDNAQGYCEMYCDSYNSCFNPDNCKKQKEIAMYDKLRDYENSRFTPVEVRKIANRRLIDKDLLLETFGQYVKRRGNIIYTEMGLQDILDIVEDAPEVISIEKDGEK